jgi:hypothetical protein
MLSRTQKRGAVKHMVNRAKKFARNKKEHMAKHTPEEIAAMTATQRYACGYGG